MELIQGTVGSAPNPVMWTGMVGRDRINLKPPNFAIC